MNRIYVPMTDLDDWKRLLADPDRQWKSGFSAMSIAQSWYAAKGFPANILSMLSNAGEPFQSLTPLAIFPEHPVALPGGATPAQSDVWVLASHINGLASITVEGKISESFGPTLGQWMAKDTDGRNTRIDFLKRLLGLTDVPGATRYQLLHRTASAILEAKRFHANVALIVVQSFSETDEGFDDFQAFCALFGLSNPAEPNKIIQLGRHEGIPFYAAWVRDHLHSVVT